MPDTMRRHVDGPLGNRLHRLLRGVEASPGADALALPLARSVAGTLGRGRAGDVLRGTWLGHALHPVLTDFADGAWMAGSFLDLFGPPGADRSSQRLVGFGLLAAVPTALTGLVEWAHTDGRDRRVGLLHLTTSTGAFVLYGCSYRARRRRRHAAGVALGVVGGVLAIVDGYVGGHLSLALGVGVSHTAFARVPPDWVPVLAAEDLPEHLPTRASVEGTDLVVVRRGDQLFALADECTYRGGHLHRGALQGDALVCPRHGCTFRLGDGAVVRGPAVIPQPAFEARLHDGRVEVRDSGGAARSGSKEQEDRYKNRT